MSRCRTVTLLYKNPVWTKTFKMTLAFQFHIVPHPHHSYQTIPNMNWKKNLQKFRSQTKRRRQVKGKLPQLTFQLQLFDGPSCFFLLARLDRNRFCRLSFFCLRNYFRLLFSTILRVLFFPITSRISNGANVNKIKLKPQIFFSTGELNFSRRVNKCKHFVVSREIDRELMTVGISDLLPSMAQDKEKKTSCAIYSVRHASIEANRRFSLALTHPSIGATTIEMKITKIPIRKYPRPSFSEGDWKHRIFMDD